MDESLLSVSFTTCLLYADVEWMNLFYQWALQPVIINLPLYTHIFSEPKERTLLGNLMKTMLATINQIKEHSFIEDV